MREIKSKGSFPIEIAYQTKLMATKMSKTDKTSPCVTNSSTNTHINPFVPNMSMSNKWLKPLRTFLTHSRIIIVHSTNNLSLYFPLSIEDVVQYYIFPFPLSKKNNNPQLNCFSHPLKKIVIHSTKTKFDPFDATSITQVVENI